MLSEVSLSPTWRKGGKGHLDVHPEIGVGTLGWVASMSKPDIDYTKTCVPAPRAPTDRPPRARTFVRGAPDRPAPAPSPIHRRSPHRSPSRRARSRGRHRLGGFRTRRRRCRPSITPKPPAATDSRTSRRASDAKIASNTSSSSARTRSRRAKSPPRGVLRRVSCFRESIRDASRGKTLTAPPSQLRGGKGETLALPPGGAGHGVLGQIRHDGPAASIDVTGFSRGK